MVDQTQGLRRFFTVLSTLFATALVVLVLAGCPEPLTLGGGTASRAFDLDGPGQPSGIIAFDGGFTEYDPEYLQWQWTPTGGGIGEFRLRVNDGPWIDGVTSPFVLPAEYPGGAYTVQVQERDEVGNWSESVVLEDALRVREPAVDWNEIDGTFGSLSPDANVGYDGAAAPVVTMSTHPGFNIFAGGTQGGLTGRHRVVLDEITTNGAENRYDLVTRDSYWQPPEELTVGSYVVSITAESVFGDFSAPAVIEFDAYPTTIYVDAVNGSDANDGTSRSPKQTIAGALSAHSFMADVSSIQLAPGTYPEQVTLTLPISIYGSGPETVIAGIDGTQGATITVSTGAAAVTLSQLTVEPPTAASPEPSEGRAAIQLNASQNVWMEGLVIRLAEGTTPATAIHGIYGDLNSTNYTVQDSVVVFGGETGHSERNLLRFLGGGTIQRNRLFMAMTGAISGTYNALQLGDPGFGGAFPYTVASNVIVLEESGSAGTAELVGFRQRETDSGGAVSYAVYHNTFASVSESAMVSHYLLDSNLGQADYVTMQENLFVNAGGTPLAIADNDITPGTKLGAGLSYSVDSNYFSGFSHTGWYQETSGTDDLTAYGGTLNVESIADPAVDPENWYRPSSASPPLLLTGASTAYEFTLDIDFTERIAPISFGAWEVD